MPTVINKNIKQQLVVILIILFYLTFNSGLHSDDYVVIKKWTLSSFLLLTPENLGLKISSLPDYLLFWWIYPTLKYNYLWFYDLIKCLSHLAAIYMAWRFFSLFIGFRRSFAASLFFILSPLHETTTYWYMTAPYIFWPGVIMYSFYLLSINKLIQGFMLGAFGAFSGYWSPPYTFGLSIIFFIRREYLKSAIFIAPGFLYVIYYFYLKMKFPFTEGRINPEIDIELFSRGILMQFLGLIDSLIGPSAFIKIYYSTLSIGLISFFIVTVIFVFLWCKIDQKDIEEKDNSVSNGLHYLLIGAISILLLSLAMFALTGLYVPSPFNLGNRSLVYGSLIISVFLASLVINRKNLIIIWLLFVLPVFGLSDYWKTWNNQQIRILENIQNQEGLYRLQKNDTLIVTGNIYNKLGPFSHIEFFSMPWVTSSIFRNFGTVENVIAINQTIFLEENILNDRKFGNIYPITGNIYIYNSESNTLTSGTQDDIERLIMQRPQEIRHWVQLAKGTFIESYIVALSPRLQYLFVK
jgi:hypothetical protein